jgi:hypothetical protein
MSLVYFAPNNYTWPPILLLTDCRKRNENDAAAVVSSCITFMRGFVKIGQLANTSTQAECSSRTPTYYSFFELETRQRVKRAVNESLLVMMLTFRVPESVWKSGGRISGLILSCQKNVGRLFSDVSLWWFSPTACQDKFLAVTLF